MKTSLYDQEYIQNLLSEDQPSTTNLRYVNSLSNQMKKSYQLKEYNQNYSSKTTQQKTQQSLSEKSYNELKNNLLANKNIDPFMKNNNAQQGTNINRLSPSKQQNVSSKNTEQISIQNHSNNYSQIKENIRPTSTDLTSQYLSQKLSTSNVYNNKLDKQKYRVGTLPSDDNSFDKFDYLLANENYKKPVGRQSTIVSSTTNSQLNYNDQENPIDFSLKNKQISTTSSTILQKKYYQTRGRESQKESQNINVKQSNQEKIVGGGGTGGGLLTSTSIYSQTPNNKNFANQMNTNANQNQAQMMGQNQSNTFIPGNYQSYTLNNARPQSQYAPRSSNLENKSISLQNFELAREKKKMNLKEIELKLMSRQQSRDNKNSADFENQNNANAIKQSVPSTTTGTMYSNYLLEKQKLMDSSELNNNITSTIKNSFLNYKQRSEKNSKISINPAVSLDLQKYGSQRISQNQNEISQQQEQTQQLSAYEAKKNSVSSVNTTTNEQYQQNQISGGQNRLSQKSTSTNTSTSINATLSNNNAPSTSNQINYQKNDNQMMKTLKKQNFKKDSLQNIDDFEDNFNTNNQEITLAQKIQQSQIQLQNQEQMYRNLNSKNHNAKFFNNFVSDDNKLSNNNIDTRETDGDEITFSQQQQQLQQQKLQKQVEEKSIKQQPSTFLKYNNNNNTSYINKEKQQIQNKQQQNTEETNSNGNIKLNYRSSTPQNKSHNELKKQPQQNSVQSTQKKRDEYQEYKKLQEKLNFLENKILSIKTNIEINQNSQLANAATTAITEKHHKQLTQQSGLSHQKLWQQKDVRLSMDKQINNKGENNQESSSKNQNQKVNQNSSQLSKDENNNNNNNESAACSKAQQQSQKKNSFFSPSNKIYQTLHTGQTPKTSTNHLNDGGFAFFTNNNNSNNNKEQQQSSQKNNQLNNNTINNNKQSSVTTGQQQKHLKKVQQSTEQLNIQQTTLINSNNNNNKMTKSQQITTYQKIMQKNDSLKQSTTVTTTSNSTAINTNSNNNTNNVNNLKNTTNVNSNNNNTNTQYNKSAKTNNYSLYQQQQQTNQVQKAQQKYETNTQTTTSYTNSMQNLLTSQQNLQQQQQLQQNQAQELNKQQQQPSNIGVGLQSLVTQINKGNFLPAGFSTTNKQFQKIQSEQIQQKSNQSQQQIEKPQQQQSQQQQQSIPKSFLHNNKNTEKNTKNSTKNSHNNSQLQQQQNSSTQKQATNQNNNNLATTTHLTAYRKSQIQKENQQNKEMMEKKLVQQCKNLYYLPKIIHSFIEEGEVTYFVQLFREHLVQTMQAINFSKFLRPVSQKVIDEKKQNFARKNYYKDKKTLIFDLDETLIHCNDNINVASDVVLPIQFPNGSIIEAGINIRPYTIECLKELSLYYEIIVFTASHSCYANVVLDYLDPNQEYIQHRLFRENCVQTDEGIYIKDLRVIGNRDLNNVIIIDNAAYSFGFHINNGIPIIPYYDNKEDTELKDLTNYLKKIHQEENISYINSLVFKLNDFADHSDPTVLAQTIYQDLLNSNQFDQQQW